MSEEILINFTPQETRVAVMQQGVVAGTAHRAHGQPRAGRQRLSRAHRAAFCPACSRPSSTSGWSAPPSCTSPTSGSRARTASERASERPIERMLFEGQSLVVQVVKDPIGTKGARLLTQISIAGRMLVYLPQEKHIGISQRIENEAEREALREQTRAPGAGGRTGRLHRAHHGRERHRRGTRHRHRLPAQDLARHPRQGARLRAADAALSGTLARPARAARFRQSRNGAHRRRLARELPAHDGLRRRIHADGARRCSSTTPASARCSTCTASRTKSSTRWPAASISSRAAT